MKAAYIDHGEDLDRKIGGSQLQRESHGDDRIEIRPEQAWKGRVAQRIARRDRQPDDDQR